MVKRLSADYRGAVKKRASLLAGRALYGVALMLVAASAQAAPLPAPPAPQPAEPAEAKPPSDREIAEGLMLSARVIAPKKRAACGEADSKGDIVVCGADRGEKWRVPSETDSNPTSREAQNTGIARAPDVSNLPDCSRGCIGFGKAPPRIYTIDMSKMPAAPKDSDADLVARGEMAER